MNKSVLKNFATSARNELIKKVEARALKIGITEESIKKAQFESSDAIYIDEKQLSLTEKKQRDKLIQRIREIGFKNVVEEVAYTWFNRFIALRFMEVNNYLPTKVRVLSSSEPGNPEPDIIKEALSVDLDIDKELVYDLKLNNKTEELFKYMVIKQCNDLNKYLPFMFETIEDYKEILFPEGLLTKDSFLREMTDVTAIPESNWEQVEIIGWLYQFYIAEKKDQVFADLKKNIKISKENIPAATQLFTPHWIVRYMVENSLGRLWLESYPGSPLKSEWKYFLEEAEQEQQVKDELEKICRKNIDPESITFLDPCCGSGHILVYAFDVFYAMYLEKGYIPHEIPKLILEKNLFGLDIDDRAAQLASFAVMMKAREKSRRVFGQAIQPNICAIQESNWMTDEIFDVLVDKTASQLVRNGQMETLHHLRDTFREAKNFGSILKFEQFDLDFVEERLSQFASDSSEQGDLLERISTSEVLEKMPELILQAKLLSHKYDVVCTNPPYMGNSGMGSRLSDYLKQHYPESKLDIFAVFIEVCGDKVKMNGYEAVITQQAWMFLANYYKLRCKVLYSDIINMIHLGAKAFEEIGGQVVQTTAFVVRNTNIANYRATYVRLTDYDQANLKEAKFLEGEGRYLLDKTDFSKIPSNPISYWVNQSMIDIFANNDAIGGKYQVRNGITTGENDKFIRYWYEVCSSNKTKWFPCNKGGTFRKWYGNQEFVIDWEDNGYRLRTFTDAKGNARSTLRGIDFNFEEAITMSRITSSVVSYRWLPQGFITESASHNIYFDASIRDSDKLSLLGLLNTKASEYITRIYNPTINIQPNDIRNIPLQFPNIDISEIVKENVDISRQDWDNFETSWNFKKHPLIVWRDDGERLQDVFEKWKGFTEWQFSILKSNEEKLNRLFIQAYGLQEELDPEVKHEDITIRTANQERDVKGLVSYAVGCMFGRYSLDHDGVILDGGKLTLSNYSTFSPAVDNILPVLSGPYLEDDIMDKFVSFMKTTFGEGTLTENLKFISDALGRKDSETPREAIQRYFLNDFFKDHLQTYKKKPIYWLFTSGKQKAFNCFIYMHRYDKTTLSRIRTDYVHELQMRLDAERKSLLNVIEEGGTAKEISAAKRELKTFELKIEELKEYEELLHHMADMQIEIDLDDGVDRNYAKFGRLLATVK